MRQLVKWVDARQKTSGGVVLWGDMRVLAIAIDDNSARLEFLESEHDEQCKAIGNASAAAAKNASNANFWTDKYLIAQRVLAETLKERDALERKVARVRARLAGYGDDSKDVRRVAKIVGYGQAQEKYLLVADLLDTLDS